jgi:predicted phage terminase large subunit-like protein
VTYLEGATAETFDLESYLLEAVPDERLLAVPEGRQELTRLDPLLFALIYLPHHLKGEETQGQITFSDAHLDWLRMARRWIRAVREPMEQRDAFIAPRSTGKSTWWFLLLPMWAAAHGHLKFIAAFSDSTTQAELHLSTFKHELESNELLRQDFPDLCSPATRTRGQTLSDTKGMLITKAGFVFGAKGIDSGALGMKVKEQRPDCLILDDIEPGEDSYSAYRAEGRLKTFQDVILPLNVYARVVMVGTVTMPGSIVHQLVKHAAGRETAPWIVEENIQVHHYLPIIIRDDGTERSIWPAKWSLEYLLSIRHTRSFAKNFLCDPLGNDGGYWTIEDIRYGEMDCTHVLLSVDPTMTTKTTSDFTGLAVVGYSHAQRRCVVLEALEIKLTGAALTQRILGLLEAHQGIGMVLVETNQGGPEIWREILSGLPVPVRTVAQRAKKEVRAGQALNHYQRGRVLHAKPLPALEAQMVSFPRVPHDDVVDAVVTGVNYFLSPEKRPRASATTVNYAA